MHYRFEQHLILHVFDHLMRLYIELEFLTSHSVIYQTILYPLIKCQRIKLNGEALK